MHRAVTSVFLLLDSVWLLPGWWRAVFRFACLHSTAHVCPLTFLHSPFN